MAILLGIDLETTGLDPETSDIIEVGVVLWDTRGNNPLEMMSMLVIGDDLVAPHVPDDITALTGITQTQLEEHGHPISTVVTLIDSMVGQVDYWVAHNAPFEKSFLPKLYPAALDAMWVDTKTDLPYKGAKGKGSLSEIAMNHGIFNPMPHRALPDTLAMMQVLAQYPFEEVEIYANAPTRNLVIRFPYDATGEKNKVVKSLGYYWNPDGKYWHKPVKEFFVDEELGNAHAHGFVPDVLAA